MNTPKVELREVTTIQDDTIYKIIVNGVPVGYPVPDTIANVFADFLDTVFKDYASRVSLLSATPATLEQPEVASPAAPKEKKVRGPVHRQKVNLNRPTKLGRMMARKQKESGLTTAEFARRSNGDYGQSTVSGAMTGKSILSIRMMNRIVENFKIHLSGREKTSVLIEHNTVTIDRNPHRYEGWSVNDDGSCSQVQQ